MSNVPTLYGDNLTKFTEKSDFHEECNDLYEAIYKQHKHLKSSVLKLVYDDTNYIETNINTIFYYLIGNESIIK